MYNLVGRTSKEENEKGHGGGEESKQAGDYKTPGTGRSAPREIQRGKRTTMNKEVTNRKSPVKTQDFVIYCRQFATLIRAGVSIVQSTQDLGECSRKSKALKRILSSNRIGFKAGISFSRCGH